MPKHEFRCPDCGRSCELDTSSNGLRHELPACKVFKAMVPRDGQAFLKLANLSTASGGFPAVLKLKGRA